MKRPSTRYHSRHYRHRRIRATIRGTADCPRLTVYRSVKHISAQLIDDAVGRTIVGATEFELPKKTGTKTARAMAVGALLATKATAKKINRVVFDRGGFKYHGRVKALADAARTGGLQF